MRELRKEVHEEKACFFQHFCNTVTVSNVTLMGANTLTTKVILENPALSSV